MGAGLGLGLGLRLGLELGLGLELPCDTAREPESMQLTNNMNVLSLIGCRLVPWICSGYLTPQ
jgi:hypothetical protein